jgi:hypothetical protein
MKIAKRKILIPLILIMHASMVFAASSGDSDDITARVGGSVQDSKSRALVLPGGMTENSLNLYDNPARITDVSGVYLDGYAKETNFWGGTVIPLPLRIKAGLFFRHPLSETSPLRNCLVEPSLGTKSSFSSMVNSGDTVLGIVDPDCKYFGKDTGLPSKSVSELTTGDGKTKGFGNFDAFQGVQIGLVHLGLMESFSRSSVSKREIIGDGSSRSLGYSASEKRFACGLSSSKIGFLSADFSYSWARHDLSFDYNAATSAAYPVFGSENLSESIHCKSAENRELGVFFRAIASFEKFKVFGTIRSSRYDIPIITSGKLASSETATVHQVRYNTSYTALSYDLALHQIVGDDCTVIYSAGFTRMDYEYTKRTVTAPSSSDSSIWGSEIINDVRKKSLRIIPIGVSAEFGMFDSMILLRTGVRKYIYALCDVSYIGKTGSTVKAYENKGKYATGDHFIASGGISIRPEKSINIDVDVDASNGSVEENETSSIRAGLSLRYLY